MRTQSLEDFCNWIEQTSLSQAVQSNAWVVPTVQTIHILAIAAVLVSTLLINLRLLNLSGNDMSVSRLLDRYQPIIWKSLPILLVTGLLLIAGEPARSLANDVFQLKMLLLLGVIALMVVVRGHVRKDSSYYDPGRGHRGQANLFALTSLALWVGIVCAGRWIAYTYS